MSDETNSPGPWRWDKRDEKGEDRPALVAADGSVVCDFGNSTQYYPSEGTEPKDADARLISAAPVMRDALQVLLDATKNVAPEEGAAKAVAMLRAVGIELDDG